MKTSQTPSRWHLSHFIDLRCALWAAICATVFLLLAADVRYHGLFWRLDHTLSSRMHSLQTPTSVFFNWVTYYGDPGTVRKLSYIMVAILGISRRWYQIPGFTIAVIMGMDINAKLQHLLGRHRPHFEDLALRTDPGFPSGHTAAAALFYGYMAAIVWIEYGSRGFKWTVTSIAAVMILLVAISRVALLAHFTGDVVAAMLWSTAWIIGCYFASRQACRFSLPRIHGYAGV
jgi:undecaprenyl-diphosphatase